MSNLEIPSDYREFRCIHCDGKIHIPKDLAPTTGPCPHCQGIITSPPLVIEESAVDQVWVGSLPVASALSESVATKLDMPVKLPVVSVEPPVVSVEPPVVSVEPPVVSVEPPVVSVEPPAPPQDATVTTKTSIPPRKSSAPAKDDAPVSTETAQMEVRDTSGPRRKSGLIPVMLIMLVLLLASGAVFYLVISKMGSNVPPLVVAEKIEDASESDAQYLRIGWQKEAYQVLRDFIAATSTKDKLPYVLNSNTLASTIEDFYGGTVINDSDTTADVFSVYELDHSDHKRGLFRMVYDQPPQFDIKEYFRPLATAEVQAGIDEAGLLLNSVARAENFTMEPLRVHAYFKRTPDGLKLDWEVFVQTKYRTLKRFVELPEAGQIGVFRVFVVEDVPDKSRTEAGTRTYRVFDTANQLDFARVNVKVDSEVGRALSVINWRETKDSRPTTRTATVELKWSGEENAPELEISRFVCWEFLGLGGQETSVEKSGK